MVTSIDWELDYVDLKVQVISYFLCNATVHRDLFLVFTGSSFMTFKRGKLSLDHIYTRFSSSENIHGMYVYSYISTFLYE